MEGSKNNKIQNSIKVLDKDTTPMQVLEDIAYSGIHDEAFFVMDIDDVKRKFDDWNDLLPNIKPFYAVKCNESPLVLQVLAALGTGFDCASKVEMERILALGVSPERIIFAHPVKIASHIKYAGQNGVRMMTFDNHKELGKIKKNHPNPKLVLRLRVDDKASAFPLGAKFGCDPEEVPALLKHALELGLEVIGVSFHVGSECRDITAFPRAIDSAFQVVEQARALGIPMNLLDLGGGFPGETDTSIAEIADLIKDKLGQGSGPQDLEVISEPGRYFVASAFTLATSVHSIGNSSKPTYYISEGLYGSLNVLKYEPAIRPNILKKVDEDEEVYESIVWGPSCCATDQIAADLPLPRLDIGDWLVYKDMGAYSTCLGTTFNGFLMPVIIRCVSQETWKILKGRLNSMPHKTPVICCNSTEHHEP